MKLRVTLMGIVVGACSEVLSRYEDALRQWHSVQMTLEKSATRQQ